MSLHELEAWMWAEASAMLDRADRMHRQIYRLADLQSSPPTWEPPVDIYETRYAFKIMIALPGVLPEHLQVTLERSHLHIRGQRHLPVNEEAEIRRLEIPYGRFERNIDLPQGHFEMGSREFVNGCLLVTLQKQ